MPFRPQRHNPDRIANVQFRVPGHLKNDILALASSDGLSLNNWIVNVLSLAVKRGVGVPPPPPAAHPRPSPEDVVRAYVLGERLLGPCGAICTPDPETIASVEWCRTCNLRIG